MSSLDSSQERWLVNGNSLSTYAWAVKTFGGSPRALPTLRGGNIQVAYTPGQLFRPKFPDSRVITLLMWTAGINPYTGQPSTNPTLQFSDNFRTLQQLFYTPGSELQLTREWRYTAPVDDSNTNLTTNGSFQSGTTGWSATTSFLLNSGATLSSYLLDSQDGDGFSCKVVTTSGSTKQGVQQTVTGLLASTTYQFSAWVKILSGSPSVTIATRDTTNSISGTTQSVTVTSAWTFISSTITTGATGNASVLVAVSDGSAALVSTFLVDNVQAYQTSTTGTPQIVSATTNAQIAGTMEPTMTGQGRADFAVDLLLSDPYFYGALSTTAIPYNSPTSIYNSGDDIAAYKNFTITFTGPLFYPVLTNNTNGAFLQFNTLISPGDSLTVDVGNFTAVRTSDGLDLAATVQHSGNRRWMYLNTNNNSLTLTSSLSTDTGSASLSFTPAYV